MTARLARAVLRALAFPALAVVILVGVPRLAGWQTYALGSGSMQPAIPAGSVVVLRPAGPADLRTGDIVGVDAGDVVLVHRVVAVAADGSLTLRGDANGVADAKTWPPSSVVGVVAYAVPLAGYAVLLLQDAWLGSVPALALISSLALLARPQAQRFALAAGLGAVVAMGTLVPAVAPFTAASAAGPSETRTDRLLPASALSGRATADGIQLDWSASASANVQYRIDRCTGSGCTSFAFLTTTGGTSYLDETVDRRTWYGYRVAAAYVSWTSAYAAAVWARAR